MNTNATRAAPNTVERPGMTLSHDREERRLTGLGISEGVALGRVRLVESHKRKAIPFYTLSPEAIPREKARLAAAIEGAAGQLDELIGIVTQKIGPAQANIFVAQKMMVQDEVLHQQMTQVIEQQRLNAESAVEKTLEAYEALLSEVDNSYLKERASDIGEIRRRLQDFLRASAPDDTQARQEQTGVEGMCIVVAEELTPSETVGLDTTHTVGFITERGGPSSHAAILARALGIPAVSGIKNLMGFFAHGEEALINGSTGEVILAPLPHTLRLYPAAKRPMVRRLTPVPPVPGIEVMANISLASEMELANTVQAEGIGLYRTEFELLAAGKLLSEEEQYERYATVVKGMEGRPVYIRLFDLGSDKPATFLEIPREENPCLGYRGARLLLGQPELFASQARAIARASAHGPIHVVYPMISDIDQFLKLRALFLQHTGDLEQGAMLHGVMLEVPSACLAAREILETADFASIGSNDLYQYLFALDRNNERVAPEYRPDRPVFWELLSQITAAAKATGKKVSLCGEIGGHPQYLARLLNLGLCTVSVNPRFVGLARMAARRWHKTQAVREKGP